jgi:hypothetical protein
MSLCSKKVLNCAPSLWPSVIVGEYAIAPDGKSVAAILYPPAGKDQAAPVEAIFVLNFLDELRRRMSTGK